MGNYLKLLTMPELTKHFYEETAYTCTWLLHHLKDNETREYVSARRWSPTAGGIALSVASTLQRHCDTSHYDSN